MFVDDSFLRQNYSGTAPAQFSLISAEGSPLKVTAGCRSRRCTLTPVATKKLPSGRRREFRLLIQELKLYHDWSRMWFRMSMGHYEELSARQGERRTDNLSPLTPNSTWTFVWGELGHIIIYIIYELRPSGWCFHGIAEVVITIELEADRKRSAFFPVTENLSVIAN